MSTFHDVESDVGFELAQSVQITSMILLQVSVGGCENMAASKFKGVPTSAASLSVEEGRQRTADYHLPPSPLAPSPPAAWAAAQLSQSQL